MRAIQRSPALYTLTFFIAGILLATRIDLPTMPLLVALPLSLIATLLCCRQRLATFRRLILCLALVTAGALVTRLQYSDLPVNHISNFADSGRPLTMTGHVDDEPDVRLAKTFLTVAVDSIFTSDLALAVCGRIRLQIGEPTSYFNYQDRIHFHGYLNSPLKQRNPGGFDYRRYLLIRDIHALVTVGSVHSVERLEFGSSASLIRGLIVPLREYIVTAFERHLPRAQSALMRGFLLGDVRDIPRATYERFRDTGTLHVLAASGANVAYVVATVFIFLRLLRVSRRFRYLTALVAIFIFSFLAFNQPSVVRASLMGATGMIGLLLFRDVIPLNVISFSALLILALRPLYLFDVGFQLSYAAAYGLVLFMPEIDARVKAIRGRLGKILRWPLLLAFVTIVAQVSVLPIQLNYFHQVPLVSFLSNLLVVPLVGICTGTGIVQVLVAPLPGISHLTGIILSQILSTTVIVIDYFHSLEVPKIAGPPLALPLIVAYFCTLLLIRALLGNRRKLLGWLLISLVALNVWFWEDVFGPAQPDIRVTIFDVGPSSAGLVQERPGRATLINGGGSYETFDRGRLVIVPALLSAGVERLTKVVATDSSEANLLSILSVLSDFGCLDRETDSATAYSEPVSLVQFINPVIEIGSEHANLIWVGKGASVRQLRRLPQRIDILACTWNRLSSSAFHKVLGDRQIGVVVVSNYPGLGADRSLLDCFRLKHPGLEVYSALESGSLILELKEGCWRVLSGDRD